MNIFSSPILIFLCARGIVSFQPLNSRGSITHRDITRKGALRVTYRMFQQIPNFQGMTLPPGSIRDEELTAENLFQVYYGGAISPSQFSQVLEDMAIHNAAVDVLYAFSSKRHFDSEMLLEGKEKILELLECVVRNIQQEHFKSAQKSMGRLLHTLQDFYSHSNWVELGFKKPNSNIIIPDGDIGPTAAKDERTCRDCETDVCHNNILESIQSRNVLTTGYFNVLPFGKPRGKCSHGGLLDLTSHKDAKGGINKDTVSSPHGYLHREAARVALEATEEAFGQIRDKVGDKLFLRFLNANSPTSLVLVLDTKMSMAENMDVVKERVVSIVDRRRGSAQEPSHYALVPFNDPDYGPVFKTSQPKDFKESVSALRARGGGINSAKCLHALQQALTNSPPNSPIYVFTDGAAGDSYLQNTILALIQESHCQVYFFLTPLFLRRRRSIRRRLQGERGWGFDLYRRIAVVSGGDAIALSKQHLFEVTSIIDESTTASMVTLLRVSSTANHIKYPITFYLDTTIHNVTIYIADNPTDIRITNPTGVSQVIVERLGSLATTKTFGNLKVIQLHSPIEAGVWELRLRSNTEYSVRITGLSLIDFSYSFTEHFGGAHNGFTPISGRPNAGRSVTLMISVTGLPLFPNSLVTDLLLVDVNGMTMQNGRILNDGMTDTTFLVEIEKVPKESFFVLIKGQDGAGNIYQRLSTTLLSTAHATLT
ncbi:von Willebrand factor A domain-containing protein 7-like, partial [Carcharodon carcharias]|uniref:von Willebrand factor A domain-containing protein 7-like n=1 Tax=Carcharodon carcharias TaxID=13397 RepID=UPI001B7DD619